MDPYRKKERAAWIARHAHTAGARRRAEVLQRQIRRDARSGHDLDYALDAQTVTPWFGSRWVSASADGDQRTARWVTLAVGALVLLVIGWPALLAGVGTYLGWYRLVPRVGPIRPRPLLGLGTVGTVGTVPFTWFAVKIDGYALPSIGALWLPLVFIGLIGAGVTAYLWGWGVTAPTIPARPRRVLTARPPRDDDRPGLDLSWVHDPRDDDFPDVPPMRPIGPAN